MRCLTQWAKGSFRLLFLPAVSIAVSYFMGIGCKGAEPGGFSNIKTLWLPSFVKTVTSDFFPLRSYRCYRIVGNSRLPLKEAAERRERGIAHLNSSYIGWGPSALTLFFILVQPAVYFSTPTIDKIAGEFAGLPLIFIRIVQNIKVFHGARSLLAVSKEI